MRVAPSLRATRLELFMGPARTAISVRCPSTSMTSSVSVMSSVTSGRCSVSNGTNGSRKW
ncbi:hypothetical protein D9M69_618280 [compost metagenome]